MATNGTTVDETRAKRMIVLALHNMNESYGDCWSVLERDGFKGEHIDMFDKLSVDEEWEHEDLYDSEGKDIENIVLEYLCQGQTLTLLKLYDHVRAKEWQVDFYYNDTACSMHDWEWQVIRLRDECEFAEMLVAEACDVLGLRGTKKWITLENTIENRDNIIGASCLCGATEACKSQLA